MANHFTNVVIQSLVTDPRTVSQAPSSASLHPKPDQAAAAEKGHAIGESKSESDAVTTAETTTATTAPSPDQHSEAGDSDLNDGLPRIQVDGLTGPHSEYVILISSDFHEFIIKRACAYMSPTLKRIFDTRNRTVKPWTVSEVLVNYPSLVVSKVADYLIYKEYYERTQEDAPKFKVEPANVLEVLLASQFLDI
ncbi:hypothetical protein BV898_09328 [Hypsibius exemplaris]|uniref:Elongin-C n=1 Tax=Hypsibius exemplaris TaxID=2072580 RepID=A0A1W0WMP0_HYPEX|nr:hypothetical protein BV898_09328 [Hypsibius exemplaris]